MTGGVLTLGESLALFRARDVGSLATVSEFSLSIGGAESNVAIGLSRLGHETTWVGVVGDDPFGHRILRDLRAEGVRVGARVDAGAPTAAMVRERRVPGMAHVLYYRSGSAGSRLMPSDVPDDLIREHQILHVTGITLGISASARDAVFHAVAVARSSGVTVSLDLNHRPSIWRDRDPGETYREIAALADIVFAGADEATLLVPGLPNDEATAQAIARLGPREVVIKRGAGQAIAWVGDRVTRRATHDIVPVDTVGAGDAFCAGYLAGLLQNGSVSERLVLAMTTGAFACLDEGDWEGAPTPDELAMLASSEPVRR